jgi:hypothetical protein
MYLMQLPKGRMRPPNPLFSLTMHLFPPGLGSTISSMPAQPRIAFLLPLAALLGCGTGLSNPTAAAPFNLSGNWYAATPATQSGAYIGPIYSFIGALQFSNGAVTGTLRATDRTDAVPCVSPTQDLAATGSFDPSGNLTLTVPIAGGTATITATVHDPNTYTNGRWQIIGGACAMPTSSIVIAQFAPVTGTYTATFNTLNLTAITLEPGTATNLTAVLSQSATPNADGQFPLTGTITATGACSGTFSIGNQLVSGGELLPPATAPQPTALVGGVDPTAAYLVTSFGPILACGSQTYSGTLTRQ